MFSSWIELFITSDNEMSLKFAAKIKEIGNDACTICKS